MQNSLSFTVKQPAQTSCKNLPSQYSDKCIKRSIQIHYRYYIIYQTLHPPTEILFLVTSTGINYWTGKDSILDGLQRLMLAPLEL